MHSASPRPSFPDLVGYKQAGINIVGPPLFALLALDFAGDIEPSQYAKDAIKHDGDVMRVLDVLAKDVGIRGIFSDWVATVTYYASCMDIK